MERGLEPDECYVLGRELGDDEFPDIALEVVISSGGINKLAVYRGLGVREGWFWHEDRFRLYALGSDGYSSSERRGLIPELDFEELATLVEDTDQLAALKRYQARLRRS